MKICPGSGDSKIFLVEMIENLSLYSKEGVSRLGKDVVRYNNPDRIMAQSELKINSNNNRPKTYGYRRCPACNNTCQSHKKTNVCYTCFIPIRMSWVSGAHPIESKISKNYIVTISAT